MKTYVRINRKIPNFDKTLEVPGDKSISIRLILLTSQAVGKSKVYNLLESDDVKDTIRSIKSLGVRIKKINKFYEIEGVGLGGFKHNKNHIINAGNSGTFARLICGLLAKNEKTIKLVGDKSLSKRDFYRVIKPLSKFGISFYTKHNCLPLKIRGTEFLRPIFYFEKKGSAQVKSSIMLAALNTPGTTVIKCLPSRDHTEKMFKNCIDVPISVKKEKRYEIIKIQGLKNYNGFDYKVPGDISSASFFIVLTLLLNDSKLILKNINVNESRIGIIKILRKMHAKILIKNKKNYNGEPVADIHVKSTNHLQSIICPRNLNTKSIDEFLIIFLLCSKAKGISKFRGIEELRQKESDRLKFAANFLRMIGVKVRESYDGITIYGKPGLKLNGTYVVKNYLKDHRVFMMSCIAALTLGGNFKIQNKSSIKTSFPNYLKLLKELGAKIT